MNLLKARRAAVVLIAGASLLVPAGAAQGAFTYRIKADGRTWTPNFRHVEPGDKVVWKNPTSRRHTLTSWKGPWTKDVVLRPGTSTSKTFTRQAEYHFRCKRHSTVSNGECNGMCGLVHVDNY